MSGKNLSETIINIVLIIVGAVLWIMAQKIEVGAAMGHGGDFMPKICATAWLIISILMLLFRMRKSPAADGENESISVRGFLLTLALLLVYVFLLEPVGFVIMSVIYMFIQMLLFVPKEKMTKKTVIVFAAVSVILPIAVDLLFVNVFSLVLPTGFLG